MMASLINIQISTSSIKVDHSEPLHKHTVDTVCGAGESSWRVRWAGGRQSDLNPCLWVWLVGAEEGNTAGGAPKDKTRHSPGHGWATRLAPDLHIVHKQASGPTGSHTHTHTQGLTMGKSIRFIIGGRLQKESENHSRSTQGCTRLKKKNGLIGNQDILLTINWN